MKKIVILLVFILSSCGIEYAGGTKIVIKGKVVDSDNNPIENKEQLIKICGHYVLSDKNFIKKIKNNLRSDIDTIIKNNIIQKLKELYGTN